MGGHTRGGTVAEPPPSETSPVWGPHRANAAVWVTPPTPPPLTSVPPLGSSEMKIPEACPNRSAEPGSHFPPVPHIKLSRLTALFQWTRCVDPLFPHQNLQPVPSVSTAKTPRSGYSKSAPVRPRVRGEALVTSQRKSRSQISARSCSVSPRRGLRWVTPQICRRVSPRVRGPGAQRLRRL